MSDVIGKLTSEQALEIVERLCRKTGNVRDAIVAEAMNLLTEFSLDEVAEEVFDALDLNDVQDCFDQAGSSRDGSASPDEAALDIIEEELQPFFDQVERYHELAMGEQEATYCMAVILGIYRFAHESKSEFKQLADDAPAEFAHNLLEDWRARKPPQAAIEAMEAFMRERCPKWAGWLKEEQAGGTVR
jgi:hypothetical protein